MGFGNVSERRSAPPQVGVSVVILALGPEHAEVQDDTGRSQLWLPLVRRVRQPFLGRWALPGGNLRADRSLEQSAFEALESTTALHPRYLEQLYTFGDPDRSHGGLPMVSIVYWALVEREEANGFDRGSDLADAIGRGDAGNDSGGDVSVRAPADGDGNVRWFPEHDLPPLAFDHRAIIDYALERLRSKIEYSDVATRLLGPTFTLRQLHDVYEAIAGQDIDLANFRRKMLASGDLEDTGLKRREGRQRPAAVYRYVPRRPQDAGSAYAIDRVVKRDEGEPDTADSALAALIPSARG